MTKQAYYVRLPKTASTSVMQVIEGQPNIFNEDCFRRLDDPPKQSTVQEGLASRNRRLLGEDFWNNSFTFTFVRNPWDRLVSAWKHFHPDWPFEQYVKHIATVLFDRDSKFWTDVWHTLPQYGHLHDDRGQLVVDLVGRFENLERDFNLILTKIGAPKIELPMLNRTKHSHYSEYYTPSLVDIVEDLYQKDIEAFGYSFENSSTSMHQLSALDKTSITTLNASAYEEKPYANRKKAKYQLRAIDYGFGNKLGTRVTFNVIHQARDWVVSKADVFYFENFLNRLGLTDQFYFVISDRPEVLFYSVYTRSIKKREKVSYFMRNNLPAHYRKQVEEGMDPASSNYYFPSIKKKSAKRVFFTSEFVIPDMEQCDYAFGFSYNEKMDSSRYSRAPIYLFCAEEEDLLKLGKPEFSEDELAKEYENRNFCVHLHHHEVKLRNFLFEQLSEYRTVDAPGDSCNNMQRPPSLADKQLGGFDQSKREFLRQYRFTCAVENEVAEGYTTEKLITPLLSGSIPIYYGNPSIDRDVNPDSIVCLKQEEWALNPEERIERLVERVIELDQDRDAYIHMRQQPVFNAQQLEALSTDSVVAKFRQMLEQKS